ncbi:MAG: hypothetical protein JSV91_11425 [Phycisphaerales bacterium]|nr:MAG: hypothetical protein JSV91_11425 [Phycisphaerales bacterium]
MNIRAIGLTTGLAAFLALTACHTEKGGWMPYTGGSTTYISTQTEPKTVILRDVRSGEILWQMEIPPGKQLTLDFVEGGGDDPDVTPDLMRWQLFEPGTKYGRLRNSITVPPADCLSLDMEVRPGPEYIAEGPEQRLRTDEMIDRPEYWTPVGGPLPDDPKGVKNYDD